MTDLLKDSVAAQAAELLDYYSFDLGGYAAAELIRGWLAEYPAPWVRTAVVEALYQGRYKAISVEQILALWKRRDHPIHHFNHEFERIICGKFSQIRSAFAQPLSDERSDRSTTAIASSEDPDVQPEGLNQDPPLTDSLEQDIQDFLTDPANAPNAATSNIGNQGADTGDRGFIHSSDLSLPHSPSTLSGSEDTKSAESPIQPFKPAPEQDTFAVERGGWSRTESAKCPIHQFVPTLNSPAFHTKLKAVARQDEAIGNRL
jgi:hypothetical protein